jgi:hypothetical protein
LIVGLIHRVWLPKLSSAAFGPLYAGVLLKINRRGLQASIFDLPLDSMLNRVPLPYKTLIAFQPLFDRPTCLSFCLAFRPARILALISSMDRGLVVSIPLRTLSNSFAFPALHFIASS